MGCAASSSGAVRGTNSHIKQVAPIPVTVVPAASKERRPSISSNLSAEGKGAWPGAWILEEPQKNEPQKKEPQKKEPQKKEPQGTKDKKRQEQQAVGPGAQVPSEFEPREEERQATTATATTAASNGKQDGSEDSLSSGSAALEDVSDDEGPSKGVSVVVAGSPRRGNKDSSGTEPKSFFSMPRRRSLGSTPQELTAAEDACNSRPRRRSLQDMMPEPMKEVAANVRRLSKDVGADLASMVFDSQEDKSKPHNFNAFLYLKPDYRQVSMGRLPAPDVRSPIIKVAWEKIVYEDKHIVLAKMRWDEKTWIGLRLKASSSRAEDNKRFVITNAAQRMKDMDELCDPELLKQQIAEHGKRRLSKSHDAVSSQPTSNTQTPQMICGEVRCICSNLTSQVWGCAEVPYEYDLTGELPDPLPWQDMTLDMSMAAPLTKPKRQPFTVTPHYGVKEGITGGSLLQTYEVALQRDNREKRRMSRG